MLYFQQAVQRTQLNWGRASAESYVYQLDFDGQTNTVNLSKTAQGFTITVNDQTTCLEFIAQTDNSCVFVENGVRETMHFAFDDKTLYLDDGSGHFIITDITHQPAVAAGSAGNGQVKASMDGAIVDVMAKQGDRVEAGQTLIVLEAMKMEHALKAGISGVVTAVSCEAGQQVKSKQLLATIEGEQSDD